NKGRLVLDGAFDIASPASQLWLLNFCQKLRNQSFVFQSEEQDFTSCFMETFKQWMENRDCEETSVVYPCCSQSSFPYRREIFELCIKRAIMELDRNTVYHLDSKTPGPRFDINDTIRAIVLEFQSTYLAPPGLGHGWFISNLEFYDLQDSLSGGTLVAMALSVGVAFSVMLLTTWNVIISLYAILSIAGTIFVTVGSLVLLGWELNVLESVTISVAVGLSVDFAVHYGVAYRLAPQPDREGKVVFSLSRMGSAIAMAALTTFVAGAMMMPSTVLAYTQLGTFMMLIMCVSWAFATFFFQCLCRCLGPQGSCGQIPVPSSMGCGVLAQGPAGAPPAQEGKGPPGPGRYQLGGRGAAEAEHYELEPLASDQRKDGEEPCPRPSNGLVDLRHAPRVFVARETGPCACSHGPQRGPGPRTPADPHATRPAPEALCPAQECCLQYVRQPHLHHQPCFGPAGGPETPGPCRACRPSRSQTDSACAGCDCSCCGERPSTSPTNEGEAARTGGEDTPPGVPLLQDTPLLQGHTHRDTRSEPAASPRNLGCFKRRLKVKSPSAPKVEGAAAPRPSHATATSETARAFSVTPADTCSSSRPSPSAAVTWTLAARASVRRLTKNAARNTNTDTTTTTATSPPAESLRAGSGSGVGPGPDPDPGSGLHGSVTYVPVVLLDSSTHLVSSSEKPARHEHVKPPYVLAHRWSHEFHVHSSMSTQNEPFARTSTMNPCGHEHCSATLGSHSAGHSRRSQYCWQRAPSAGSTRKPSKQEHVKLPGVFAHWCSHGARAHSSTSTQARSTVAR
ncbi:hypothetical protein CRUP_021688, partial [Coryphaenoides rupestris]